MSTQRITRSTRKYWGSDIADHLVRWLNQTEGTARNRRIIDLLSRINEFIHLTDKRAGTLPPSSRLADEDYLGWGGNKMPKGRGLAARSKEIDDARSAINVLLRRYRLRPELVGRYADRSLFAWRTPIKDWATTRDKLCIDSTPPKAYVIFTESDAVKQMIELCHEGLFHRLRRCACGKWFYAKFSHSKFCATTCQQRVYRSDPEWKKYRQEWSKRNRALHKQKLFRTTK